MSGLRRICVYCGSSPGADDRFAAAADELGGAIAQAGMGLVYGGGDLGLMGRVARLLPGLFLARVDGKSPAEYITAEADKERVRRVARALLAAPVDQPDRVSEAWRKELTA